MPYGCLQLQSLTPTGAATTLSFHKIRDDEWKKKILAGAKTDMRTFNLGQALDIPCQIRKFASGRVGSTQQAMHKPVFRCSPTRDFRHTN